MDKKETKKDTEFRYEVNKEIAVVYRSSYGIGWSSHDSRAHKQNCFLAMNGQLAHLVENKNWTGVESLVKERYPEFHLSNLEDLRICWVPKGTTFEIENYDGLERIEIKGQDFFHAA